MHQEKRDDIPLQLFIKYRGSKIKRSERLSEIIELKLEKIQINCQNTIEKRRKS